MEYSREVNNAIGPHNYDLLIEDVRKGHIKLHHMKDMALKMHDHVHGTFVRHKEDEPSVLFRLLLDEWYLKVLFESNIDGYAALKTILEHKDVGLNALAKKMKPSQEIGHPATATDISPDTNTDVPRLASESAEETDGFLSTRSASPALLTYWKEMSCFMKTVTIAVIAFLAITAIATLAYHMHLPSFPSTALDLVYDGAQDEDKPLRRGMLDIGGPRSSDVKWIRRCPTGNYTEHLSGLGKKIKNFGSVQVGDEVWLCGGQAARKEGEPDQSTTCQILDLVDGRWKTFEYQMGVSRIKAVMFVDGSKVMVMSGVTSDINSRTGCHDTMEVFDTDRPDMGWIREAMGENSICDGASEIVYIDCK